MKKIIIMCISFIMLLSIAPKPVQAISNENDLNELTIEELLEYAESKNYNFEVTNYEEIDKNELVKVIKLFDSIPDVVELKDDNTTFLSIINGIGNNIGNGIQPLALPDSYESNVVARKSYKATRDGYTCSIYVYFRYDLYTDGGRKYINKINNFYTTKNSTISVNVTSYTQNTIYLANSDNYSSAANIAGDGTYRVSLAGINGDRTINFSVWFYPGERM